MITLQRIKNYPIRYIRKFFGLKKAKKMGISYSQPNYIYFGRLNQNSVVVDVGCADDPDFSIYVMRKYNCKCYGVDPTRKHFAALKKVESDYPGRFVHLPYAVADKTGKLIFHESQSNASGSILENHVNVKNDQISSYDVEAIDLKELKQKVTGSNGRIDFLKLDLEGAEYNLLSKAKSKDFENIDQLFIEFHHHCIEGVSLEDTKILVKRITNFGFSVFTIDQHNFLFYR